MTQNRQIILAFINECLEWSDNKVIAQELGVSESIVSRVRKGKETSKRILSALESRAIQNKKHALNIAEYLNKNVNI